MKKRELWFFVAVIVLILALTACNDITNSNNGAPCFSVKTVEAPSGTNDVVVLVELRNNPGFLTMAISIEYDENALALTDTVSGADFRECHFVGPKNKRSGCIASWFTPDFPERIVDGTLLELHFNIKSDAVKGDYPIRITGIDDGGTVDKNKEPFTVSSAIGYVKIR
ncbi:MAG: hypothetical protein KBS76_03705 [Ruminococcus sp.]|nr:hypothetical protein [Candidatus Apopatosoma intestinale]